MSLNWNRVTLAGNLTRDPELRTVGTDRVTVSFSLAVNRRYKGTDGEVKEEVTFVDIDAWGRTAELVSQYLTKGSPAFIEGRLKLDQWEAQDGTKRSKLKVVADTVQFLQSKAEREQQDGQGAPAAASPPPSPRRPSTPRPPAGPPAGDD
ncbi:MAG: single-stranded DNA-binding protein, partial [Planctomycetes bacterium]|nr:single-stranded DNA-binding protein [Planctomycetota bacterium]